MKRLTTTALSILAATSMCIHVCVKKNIHNSRSIEWNRYQYTHLHRPLDSCRENVLHACVKKYFTIINSYAFTSTARSILAATSLCPAPRAISTAVKPAWRARAFTGLHIFIISKSIYIHLSIDLCVHVKSTGLTQGISTAGKPAWKV